MAEDYSKKFTLASGFTVSVTPLVPYYMDIIEQVITDKKYPKRIIRNVAGDEFPIEYECPDTPPVIANREEYDLYYEWLSVDQQNKEAIETRKQMRSDFLLSMCVEVVDGPISIEDGKWKHKVEAAFQARGIDFTVPEHPGAQMLFFLKGIVITKPQEKELIEKAAVYQEVDLQGIAAALHGFQDIMEQRVSV